MVVCLVLRFTLFEHPRGISPSILGTLSLSWAAAAGSVHLAVRLGRPEKITILPFNKLQLTGALAAVPREA